MGVLYTSTNISEGCSTNCPGNCGKVRGDQNTTFSNWLYKSLPRRRTPETPIRQTHSVHSRASEPPLISLTMGDRRLSIRLHCMYFYLDEYPQPFKGTVSEPPTQRPIRSKPSQLPKPPRPGRTAIQSTSTPPSADTTSTPGTSVSSAYAIGQASDIAE